MVVLTAVVCYDVFMRYVLNSPTLWAFDVSYMLYGTVFMMCGAYTLAQNGHVRGDFLYSAMRPRKQAAIDLALYIVFFFPGILALCYAGIGYASESWSLNEHSSLTSGGPPLYHFKTVIPIAGALVMLQGLAEVVRCVMCLRTGVWPERLKDVSEIDIVATQLEQSTLVDEADRKRVIESVHKVERTDAAQNKGGR
ncbi:MAG: TRAP transporter small permease subunit [Proteobacteria bacterium]|nr:TRAP transporter small permease subunit [Burkholderiales bacterium]